MKTTDVKFLKVCKLIWKTSIDPDYVSPNFVAEIAYNNKYKLTSNEVVFICDNYYTYIIENKI